MSKLKNCTMIAALALAGAGMIWIATLMPEDCKPDGYASERHAFSVIIGGSMLLAGCPDERTPRLIYRNDGSITPP